MRYCSSRDGWQTIDAANAGMDTEKLADAVAFAEAAETSWPRDLSSGLAAGSTNREPPPWNKVLGPTRDRGGPNGLKKSKLAPTSAKRGPIGQCPK